MYLKTFQFFLLVLTLRQVSRDSFEPGYRRPDNFQSYQATDSAIQKIQTNAQDYSPFPQRVLLETDPFLNLVVDLDIRDHVYFIIAGRDTTEFFTTPMKLNYILHLTAFFKNMLKKVY